MDDMNNVVGVDDKGTEGEHPKVVTDENGRPVEGADLAEEASQ